MQPNDFTEADAIKKYDMHQGQQRDTPNQWRTPWNSNEKLKLKMNDS
jgi:hypothetical protein